MKSSEIIGSLRKPSDVFRNLRKISKTCRKVLKITFQQFWHFLKSSEVFANLRKKIGKNRKMSESSQNDLPTLFENFRNFSEIFGSVRKCSENFGNPRKISNVIGGLWTFFILFQPLTPGGTEDQIQEFALVLRSLHWYYTFCTSVTL